MKLKIEFKASVERDLRKIDQATVTGILDRIEEVLGSEDVQALALKGEFSGLYKLRVGDYRVIFVNTDEGFLILRIGHRKDVYRKGRPEV